MFSQNEVKICKSGTTERHPQNFFFTTINFPTPKQAFLETLRGCDDVRTQSWLTKSPHLICSPSIFPSGRLLINYILRILNTVGYNKHEAVISFPNPAVQIRHPMIEASNFTSICLGFSTMGQIMPPRVVLKLELVNKYKMSKVLPGR